MMGGMRCVFSAYDPPRSFSIWGILAVSCNGSSPDRSIRIDLSYSASLSSLMILVSCSAHPGSLALLLYALLLYFKLVHGMMSRPVPRHRKSPQCQISWSDRGSANGRNRHISSVAMGPAEGLLTEPTADTRACRRATRIATGAKRTESGERLRESPQQDGSLQALEKSGSWTSNRDQFVSIGITKISEICPVRTHARRVLD